MTDGSTLTTALSALERSVRELRQIAEEAGTYVTMPSLIEACFGSREPQVRCEKRTTAVPLDMLGLPCPPPVGVRFVDSDEFIIPPNPPEPEIKCVHDATSHVDGSRIARGFADLRTTFRQIAQGAGECQREIAELRVGEVSEEYCELFTPDMRDPIRLPSPLTLDLLALIAQFAELSPATAKNALELDFFWRTSTPLFARFKEQVAFCAVGSTPDALAEEWEAGHGCWDWILEEDLAYHYWGRSQWPEAFAVLSHLVKRHARDCIERPGGEEDLNDWLEMRDEALEGLTRERQLLGEAHAQTTEEALALLLEHSHDREKVAAQDAEAALSQVWEDLDAETKQCIISAEHKWAMLHEDMVTLPGVTLRYKGSICLDIRSAIESEWRARVVRPYVSADFRERKCFDRKDFKKQVEAMLDASVSWIDLAKGDKDALHRVFYGESCQAVGEMRNRHAHGDTATPAATGSAMSACEAALARTPATANWLLEFMLALPPRPDGPGQDAR